MENRKDRRASAKKAAQWERQAAARLAAVERKQRLKERTLSGALDPGIAPGRPIPGPEDNRKGATSQNDWLPLQAVAGVALTALPAYIIAEASLGTLHPLHWLVALISGLAGYAGGLILYRLRGY